MKNIADVNSDDILTELNNLDYSESDDDLKLLDDEDIRPINKATDDDLSDFYMDYDVTKKLDDVSQLDLYTEKNPIHSKPLDKYIEKANKLVEQPKKIQKEPETETKSIDAYLNRASAPIVEKNYNDIKVSNNVTPIYKPQANVQKSVSVPSVSNVKPQNNYSSSTTTKPEPEDLNQLFSKVSNNVKGASEIVNRNAEIKKKIESKFEELRQLQKEVEHLRHKLVPKWDPGPCKVKT